MSNYFISLRDVLPDSAVPQSVMALLGEDTLSNVGISTYLTDSWTDFFYLRAEAGFDPTTDAKLVLAFPQFPDLGIVLRTLGQVEVFIDDDEFRLTISTGQFSLRLPQQILKPVLRSAEGTWVEDASRDFVEVEFSYGQLLDGVPGGLTPFPFVLSFDNLGQIEFQYPFKSDGGSLVVPFASLNGPAMISESGAVINIEDVAFNFDPDDPVLYLRTAWLDLPDDLAGSFVLPRLTFTDSKISKRGFSGGIAADWPLEFQDGSYTYRLDDGTTPDAELFGINGGLRTVAVSVFENQITSSEISGGLVVPYFDEPVDIQLGILNSGDFSLTASGVDEDGVTLRKDDLIAINILRMELNKMSSTVTLTVTGGLEPLLFAGDGLQWPKLDVKNLSIEQDLADLSEPPILKFEEAWLDLKKLATIDLFGFHFELNRIGLGYQESDDKLWIDLTGMIKLMDQIPVGVGVEGFRITWPRTLYQDLGLETLFQENPSYSLTVQDAIEIARKIEVKFDGVYLFYGVPQAVEFEGYIRFLKEAQKIGFAGDVVLRVPASGLEIEAGLMIGINMAQPSPYPFLYVYFGIMLPSGIPLGQSGLALKGAKGLFGINVTPAKTPDQNWYYDWYKRGPMEGAHPTNKWEDLQWALAVGAGVTITTTDGKILGVQGLLVLAIPGPYIIIEGKALIFDGVFPGEPPLKALAVFDGKERTVQLNIEAGAELVEDVLEANGVAEAFFDFKDLTNWHLYLGQDEPQDRRIHALILKLAGSYLFRADAFLMTDMIQPYTVRSRLGVLIGFEPPIPSFGPINVTINAVINGSGELQIRAGNLVESAVDSATSGSNPTASDVANEILDNVNFSGNLDLDANLEIVAFGFGLRASASASVMCEGPKPFEIKGKLAVSVEVPMPLETVESIPLVGDFLEFVDQAVDLPEFEPIEIEIEFSFSPDDFSVHDLATPLRREHAMESHFLQKSEELVRQSGLSGGFQSQQIARQSPQVEMDHRPVLVFQEQMNVAASMASPIAAHPAGLKQFHQGMVTFEPILERIILYEHAKSQTWQNDNADAPDMLALDQPTLDSDWKKIASTEFATLDSDQQSLPLYGIWRADADTDNPAQAPRRTLRLWSTMPFGPAIGPAYYEAVFGHPNQVEATQQAHDQFFIGGASKARKICFDFQELQKSLIDRNDPQNSKRKQIAVDNPLTIEGVVLSGELGMFVPGKGNRACLISPARLRIEFPQRVRWVEIQFCGKIPKTILAETISYSLRKVPDGTPDVADIQYRSVSIRRKATGTTTLEISSDAGFNRLTVLRSRTDICRICYKTEQDINNEEQDVLQEDRNGDLFTPSYLGLQPVLKPGRHYRLVVQSKVGAKPNPNRNPFPRGTFLHGQAADLALNIVNTILGEPEGTRQFIDELYFQTDGPPTNLSRFIKWAVPVHGEKQHFLDDDFLIRFKRPYLHQLFEDESCELDAYVRSASGVVSDQWNVNWEKSQSATLTPDEQSWMDHLESGPQYDALLDSLPADDMLRISRPHVADLSMESGADWDVVELEGGRLGKWRRVLDSRLGTPIQVLRQSSQSPTIAVTKDSNCREFHFTTTLFGGKSGKIGVVFRYVDSSTYYLFSIDHIHSEQRLTKIVGGRVKELKTVKSKLSADQPINLAITAESDSLDASRFEIKLNGRVWGDYVDNDPLLDEGSIGFFSRDTGDANFSNPQLVATPPLKPQSRYELIVAGGNGGELVFGDRYATSFIGEMFGPHGWSMSSNSEPQAAWEIDADQQTITNRSGDFGDALIIQSNRLANCDLRARLSGLSDQQRVGFVIRNYTRDDRQYQYRVVVSNDDGTLNLCVCQWQSQGIEIKLCDQLLSNFVVVENLDFRINIFGNQLKVFLAHQLVKTLTVQTLASAENSSEFLALNDGAPGIMATQNVVFHNLQVRRSELVKIPFMTSRFASFSDLIDTGQDFGKSLVVDPTLLVESELQQVEDHYGQFTYQRWRAKLGRVDFRDGSIDRQQWEGIQQDHRNAKAQLDESFAGVCEKITGIHYEQLADELQSHLLATQQGVFGLYIRAPESLNLAAEIDPSLLNDADSTFNLSVWHELGSTQVEIIKNGEVLNALFFMMPNGDGNQLLLVTKSTDATWKMLEAGNYTLRFRYVRNHHDDVAQFDHRYDRPVNSTQGVDSPIVVELRFAIA